MPLSPATQPDPRQQYESLLNEVLDTAHDLIRDAGQTDPELASTIDDSKIHTLVQHLRDNFGPEVPR
jgi:hypothetical protein